MQIHSFDKKTSLSDLRDILSENATHDNTESLVMILCQRLEKLQTKVEELEERISANGKLLLLTRLKDK